MVFLAKQFDKNAQNIDEAIKFLKDVDTEMFIRKTAPVLYKTGSTQKNGEQIWSPVAEGKKGAQYNSASISN